MAKGKCSPDMNLPTSPGAARMLTKVAVILLHSSSQKPFPAPSHILSSAVHKFEPGGPVAQMIGYTPQDSEVFDMYKLEHTAFCWGGGKGTEKALSTTQRTLSTRPKGESRPTCQVTS